MQRVLVAFEEHLADPHLPRTLQDSLDRVDFQPTPPQVVSLLNVGYQSATSSRSGPSIRTATDTVRCIPAVPPTL